MSERRASITIDELIAKAQADARAIACELIPYGYDDRRSSPTARFDVDAPTGRGSSVWMILRGKAPLTWRHVAAGRGGGVLDAIQYFGKANTKAEAVEWLLRWFGIDGRKELRHVGRSDLDAEEKRRKAAGGGARANGVRDSDPARLAAWAHGLFLSAQPLPGTPGERYFAQRGADIRRLGRAPGCLRFHPGIKEPETERLYPAVVAKVDGADGNTITVHRIFLDLLEDGTVQKAAGLRKPKKWGSTPWGGLVRLWRGCYTDPKTGEIDESRPGRRWQDLWERPDWAALETITITEGIENGLALALADPSRRVAAGLSLTFLDKIVLPPGLGELVLFGDDDEDPKTRAQLEHAAEALYRQCKNIRIAQPAPGQGDALEIYARGDGVASSREASESAP